MGGFIDFLPPDQDFAVLASMARVRSNEPNGTVQMFAVVPALKACHPLAGLLEAIENGVGGYSGRYLSVRISAST